MQTAFLDLPAELRNNIYHFAIEVEIPVVIFRQVDGRSASSTDVADDLSLLWIHPQIRQEATGLILSALRPNLSLELHRNKSCTRSKTYRNGGRWELPRDTDVYGALAELNLFLNSFGDQLHFLRNLTIDLRSWTVSFLRWSSESEGRKVEALYEQKVFPVTGTSRFVPPKYQIAPAWEALYEGLARFKASLTGLEVLDIVDQDHDLEYEESRIFLLLSSDLNRRLLIRAWPRLREIRVYTPEFSERYRRVSEQGWENWYSKEDPVDWWMSSGWEQVTTGG